LLFGKHSPDFTLIRQLLAEQVVVTVVIDQIVDRPANKVSLCLKQERSQAKQDDG